MTACMFTRPKRLRASFVVLQLVLISFLATACISGSSEAEEWGPLAVANLDDGGEDSAIEGKIEAAGDCFLLRLPTGELLQLIWPKKHVEWVADSASAVFENDDDSSVSVGSNDTVQFGGVGVEKVEDGWSGGFEWAAPPNAACDVDGWWRVNSVISS